MNSDKKQWSYTAILLSALMTALILSFPLWLKREVDKGNVVSSAPVNVRLWSAVDELRSSGVTHITIGKNAITTYRDGEVVDIFYAPIPLEEWDRMVK